MRSTYEKFHVVEAADGYIGLKAGDKKCIGPTECNGGFLFLTIMQHKWSLTRRMCVLGHMGRMQKFKVTNAESPDTVTLLSETTGQYCSDHGESVVCTATSVGPDEIFTVTCLSGCPKGDCYYSFPADVLRFV